MGKRAPQSIQEEKIEMILTKAKGEVCKEFEKVCPSEMSFGRMRKEMHDIFDEALEQILPHLNR